MLHFFRKMRKALVPESRFGRYFFYAVGEIVLVVIGILIALQVNNWNEDRKSKKLEKTILQNLNSEFQKNKNSLESVIANNKESFKTGKYVMTLISRPARQLQLLNTDSLIFFTMESVPFHPSENVLNELLNSGRFQLIQNEKLKSLLYNWSSDKSQLIETFNDIDNKIENDLVPYLTKTYPLKDIDKYGILQWKNSSSLEVNKYQIFSDLEFENHIDDLLFHTANYLRVLTRMNNRIDTILIETKYNHDPLLPKNAQSSYSRK